MTIENLVEFEAKRIQIVEGLNSKVIRGISNEEATELIRRFPDYASQFPKLREGIGSGYVHANKHAAEFESEEDFKQAVNYALNDSSLVLNSKRTKLYLAGLDKETQRFMLAFTINDPILDREVMHTSYSAIAQPGPKDVTQTFERMVKSKDVKMFAVPEGECKNRTIELFTNDELAVILDYRLKDSYCFINADRMQRSKWERIKSGLIAPSYRNCKKFLSKIQQEDKVINLRMLYAA